MKKIDVLNQKSFRFLFLLLLVDFLFVLLEFGYQYTDFLEYSIYSITADRSYAEVYQYIKEFWVIALLGLFFLRTKEAVYVLWSFIFGYFLIDDCLGIHEKIGSFLAGHTPLDTSSVIKSSHVGEFIFFVALAIVFLLPLYFFHLKLRKKSRDISLNLLKLVVFLAVFGVVVDVVHGFLEGGPLDVILGALEDGGEMVIMSVIVWYAYFLHDCEDKIQTNP